MRYLLYNPLSGKTDQAREDAECYSVVINMPAELIDLTKIDNLQSFFENLDLRDDVVIFGGDGTLNKLVNALSEFNIKNDIYYFPCGTGNDFARDVGMMNTREPFLINDYIKTLPSVTVNGKCSKFINGVGFGVDGYCCEVGDRLKKENKKTNYISIAIKGILFHFKPVNATIIVNKQKMHFKKVWIAPTMYGRYYGGGIMSAPRQNRNATEKAVSFVVLHGVNKFKALMIFPTVLKGKHVQRKKNVAILKGRSITVTFDRPASLQIDGETVLNAESYTVTV